MKVKSPGGNAPALYGKLLNETHILIAGATGSGKSVFINSLITRILMEHTPATAKFILIDPKRVELYSYRKLPHVITYTDNANGTIQALQDAIREMTQRYTKMQKFGTKKSDEPAIYIIIDEYADLMTSHKKAIEPLITKIIQLGRAANIHIILATQRPTREVITGTIRVNLDCKIALRCATAQDSRNIIGQNGAENLQIGQCIIANATGIEYATVPMLDERPLIEWWTTKKCKA